ncbi:MAG TPA: YfhO family protein [Puia sp.]|nr:YfhO family protein [Puia sp.]
MNSSLIKKALPHIIAIVVFILIAVIYCKPVFDGKVVSQSDVLNWKNMAQQSFEFKEKHGHFPLWTESAFGGMPAYTIAMDATSKVYTAYTSFITSLITLGLPKPINYLFLACICFYILTQVLRINPYLGILSALCYAYATFDPVIIAVGHDTQMQAIGYAPAVIAGILLIFQRKYLLGVALFSIFFGFQISTQHLQIIYYTVITMGFISLAFFIYSLKHKELNNFFISIALAIVGGALGFGTFAISILPVQDYAKETKRGGKSELAVNSNDKNKTEGGLNKDYAFDWSYGIGETFTLIVPGIYGGGSEGKLVSDNSKFVEKATEIGMPEEAALRDANILAYWGNQPNTAGPVYLGAAICFLFIFGLVYAKSWHKWWIIPAALLGILLAWGKNFSSFNYFLFDYFPFYNKFRAPTQALFFPQLVFPLLAAIGINELIISKESKELIWKKFQQAVYVAAGLVIILAAFYFSADFKSPKDARIKQGYESQILQSAARGKQPTAEMQQQATEIGKGLIKGLESDRQSIFEGDLIRTILIMAATVVLMGLYLKDKIKPFVLMMGLMVVCSFDLLAEGRIYLNDDNFVEPSDYESAFNPTPADIQISKDPDKNFRVLDESGEWWQDSKASYFHNSLGGYSPAKLGLYQDIIDSQLSKQNIMVYNMLNTKYIIQRNPSTGQQQAMQNPNAFGPCWLVKNIHFVKDGNEEMKALDSINVKDTAIVQQKFANIIKFMPAADSTASITLAENLNDKLTYRFSAKTNQFAVFSEVYYDRGWNAFLDGQKADYCRVDYILRGMPVPPGNHNIEFRFEPKVYQSANTISVWASVIAIILLVIAGVAEWKNKTRTA